VKELKPCSSWLGYTPDEFAHSLRLLADGQVDADALITGKVGLDG